MSEPHDYYVYALIRLDTNEPFYIGKGRGNRLFDHARNPERGENRHKANIIRKCERAGVGIDARILLAGLGEEAAYQAETDTIQTIGRRPNGPLVNRTDGGEGFRGLRRSKEHRAAISAALTGKQKSGAARAAAVANAAKARKSNASRSKESCRQAIEKGLRSKPPEKRSEWQRKAWETRCANDPGHPQRMVEFGKANITPEKRQRAVEAAAAQTPEQRSERVKRANASRSPEQRRAALEKAWATRRANKGT